MVRLYEAPLELRSHAVPRAEWSGKSDGLARRHRLRCGAESTLTCQTAIAVAGAAALSLSLLLAGPVLYVGKLVL